MIVLAVKGTAGYHGEEGTRGPSGGCSSNVGTWQMEFSGLILELLSAFAGGDWLDSWSKGGRHLSDVPP